MNNTENRNRNILIAVDASENAKRAVLYVRDMLRGFRGFHITIINIVSVPPEDYFTSGQERTAWIENKSGSANKVLEGYLQLLLDSGFQKEDVSLKLVVKECVSVAECILDEQKKLSYGTVVIGRRGISKKEEFIYGSTSNRILHAEKDCSVWIIN